LFFNPLRAIILFRGPIIEIVRGYLHHFIKKDALFTITLINECYPY